MLKLYLLQIFSVVLRFLYVFQLAQLEKVQLDAVYIRAQFKSSFTKLSPLISIGLTGLITNPSIYLTAFLLTYKLQSIAKNPPQGSLLIQGAHSYCSRSENLYGLI